MRSLSRWFSFALLVGALFAVPTVGRSDDTKGLTPDERKKKIEEIQKSIEELKKQLEGLEKLPEAGTPAAPVVEGALPSSISKQITWRSVGPANMGGRIVALSIVASDPTTYWCATASGGLLKTTNNGVTFEHQFDKENVVSIGDVAHAPSKPDVVYVGTGENNPRNSVSYGDGVYKSTDGGKTWKNVGLNKTFQIGKIIVHPTNPDVVYVGALGRLYGKSTDRGLYKTEDGGKTWNKILYVDDVTGVIDMRMDPKDPNTLIVAMWGRMRDGFDQFFGEAPVPDGYGPIMTFNTSGGIWKTSDAGKTFKKINDPKTNKGNGLPTVATGRIGLDYSAKTKGLLFAIVDSEKGGTGTVVPPVYMGIIGEKVVGGIEFTSVTEGSPAEKAGIKVKDIVQVYDAKKADDYDAFLEYIKSKKPGDKVKMEILRGAEKVNVELTLGTRPEDEAAAAPAGGRGGAGAGTGGARAGGGQGGRGQGGRAGQGGGVANTRGIAGFTLSNGTDGAKVSTVTAGSAAEKAGIKAGDEITAINGKAVKTAAEYTEALGTDKKPGDKIKLTIGAGDKKKDVEVTLQAAGPAAQSGGGATPAAPAQGTGTTMLLPGFAPAFGESVTVGTVKAGSDAEKAGIKTGFTILKVDGKDVDSLRTLMSELRTGPRAEDPRKEGEKVKVTFSNEGKEVTHELAMVPVEMQGFGGGGGGGIQRGSNARFPYRLGLGGQQPNVQDRQGADGYQTGGVYMSKDNGDTWTRVNSVNPRPMYFSQVRVDPNDDNLLYVLGDTVLYKSINGGKEFRPGPANGVHADYHAFWINPANSRHMLIGCDGGTYVTYDRGEHWDHLNHVAIGQFYHVAVDNKRPYRIYGGLQDNGSWGLPSATLRARTGPYNEDSVYINGGDGFVCRVDPNDPDLIYAESQGGAMNRRNLRTGESNFIRPTQGQGTEAQRFDWNTPFILSNHNPSIFYTQSQFVYRSINKGNALKRISPETTLTKKGSGSALGESPRSPDILWAGTTDGGLWVTKDGGVKWENVTPNLLKAGLPAPRWVATVEPSKDRDGRCYVALDAHRSDDDKPYLFVTEDFGATWKSLNNNLPTFGSTRCLREDIRNPNVLYCGTEFGAYVSTNKGAAWTKMGGNLPTVAVHEFAQPTVADEIVIATHGRSVWVAEIGMLRQIKSDTLKDAVTLFTPSTAVKWRLGAGGESPYSDTVRKFVGKNPARGTSIDYHLKDPAKSVSLKILDVSGKTVAEFRDPPKTSGLHRMAWELRRGTIASTTGGAAGGRGQGGGGGGGFGGGAGPVLAGVYKVALTVDGKEYVSTLTVENDPNMAKDAIGSEEVIVVNEEEEEEEFLEELKKFLNKKN